MFLTALSDMNLIHKYFRIASVVAIYWVVSILTVFINKTLVSGEVNNLEAPLFVTWYQCLVSALICFSLSKLSQWFPGVFTFPEGSPFDSTPLRAVFPLAVLFTAMIGCNNLCLKYVGVAFYYIGRSLTTVFNVVFTYLLLGQKTSYEAMTCCALIIGGFWLGIDQENFAGTLSIPGTVFGVLGSLSLALFSIQMKKVLPSVKQQIWLLSYYNNVYACLLFLPLILITNEISAILNHRALWTVNYWILMTVGGLCGFAIGYVTTLQIQVTSPLTHNVSGTAKACAQTVLATHWYVERKPWLWWLSNWVVLGGSAAYTAVKQQEMKRDFRALKLSPV